MKYVGCNIPRNVYGQARGTNSGCSTQRRIKGVTKELNEISLNNNAKATAN